MPDAIQIESLSKIFPGRNGSTIKAVNDINLSVLTGQVFGFLGHNGAGKTTTIKMVCGLVTPTSGNVYLNGYHVSRQRGDAMRQIGAVLEGTRNVYWRLSAWENLLYFGGIKGRWGKKLKTHAERLLRELGLWERRHDPLRTFSRGMQQKVAIACALVADPAIVLLDEPTLGLDVEAAQVVKAWIEKLAHDEGKTVLITTHQLDMAEQVCDRIAIMRRGEIIADKPVGELLEMFAEERYEIKIKGHLNGHSAAFEGMSVSEHGGNTILSSAIPEPAALSSILGEVGALGYQLLAVSRMEPDLEEVFLRLTNAEPTPVILKSGARKNLA